MPEEFPKHKDIVDSEDSLIQKVQVLEHSLEEIKSSQEEWGATLMEKMDSIANLDGLELLENDTPSKEMSNLSSVVTSLTFLICSIAITATVYALFLVQQMESSWERRIQHQIDEAITLDQVIRVLKEEKKNAGSNN
ncbi:MAG: hypothetical protein NE327_09295 [Lentisphaeraceae bacterium]|nr:hypothetical protein [Lentisphaeraceae bacterium]